LLEIALKVVKISNKLPVICLVLTWIFVFEGGRKKARPPEKLFLGNPLDMDMSPGS
jgi:hypothetical protein